jgi:hypothetical protein
MTDRPRHDPIYWLGVAERDYQRGIQLTRLRRLQEAEVALKWAVALLDVLLELGEGLSWRLDVQRRLALAYWRHGLVLQLDGRPAEALTRARQGLAVDLDRLATLPPGTAERSEATAQAATAMIDAAAAAAAAGLAGERWELLDEAIRYCGDDPHPCVRSALGGALHNKANAMLLAVAGGGAGRGGAALRTAMQGIAGLASDAIGIRTELLVESDPLSGWELACSQLLGAQVLMYCGDHPAAVELLCLAVGRIRSLGPHTGGLEAKARQLARTMAGVAPGEMEAARSAGLPTSL